MDYKKSVETTLEKINSAAQRSGRNTDEITLLAVSKVFPVEVISEVYNTGIRLFGESRAQELRDKVALLPTDIKWHFIGPLQTNKVKYVIPTAELIHAVDSLKLAETIAEYGQKKGITPSILIEINTSQEETKQGLTLEKAVDIILQIKEFKNLKIKGLMTMAPYTNDVQQIRKSFSTLKRKFDEICIDMDKNEFNILSMGMSSDFEIAIEEGSTLVRVGTGIFGQRRRK